MKRVRDEMGLKNLILVIPFCRIVEEARKVIAEMEKNGLQIYAMCEIPNNVLLIEEFSEFFDGFSIGSNDLTQLTLALIETPNYLLQNSMSEIRELGNNGNDCALGAKNGRHSGTYGQAPSEFPEIAEFLVKLGIDSISLNPDSVMKITLKVLETEKEMEGNEKYLNSKLTGIHQ